MKRHQPDGSDSSLSLRLFKVTTIDQTLLNLLLTVNAKHDITSLIGVRVFFYTLWCILWKTKYPCFVFQQLFTQTHTHTRVRANACFLEI